MSNLKLIAHLKIQGIKHNPESIIEIAKNQKEQIIFLEVGNSKSGLQHILEQHEADFLRRGISKDQIPKLVITAVTQGTEIGIQGKSRTIYEIEFNGVTQYVSVTIANNGYIVGANPTPYYLIRRYTLE